MSSESDYTPKEWAALVRAPVLAGMALALADPGGPIETTKEAMATMKAVTSPDSDVELLVEVSREVGVMAKERKGPVSDFKLDFGKAGEQILQELREVVGILKAKATAEEIDAFLAWLVSVAQAAADAAKEGGFLGFGAVRVSEGEQKMVDQIRAALGLAGGGDEAGGPSSHREP